MSFSGYASSSDRDYTLDFHSMFLLLKSLKAFVGLVKSADSVSVSATGQAEALDRLDTKLSWSLNILGSICKDPCARLRIKRDNSAAFRFLSAQIGEASAVLLWRLCLPHHMYLPTVTAVILHARFKECNVPDQTIILKALYQLTTSIGAMGKLAAVRKPNFLTRFLYRAQEKLHVLSSTY